MKSRIDNEFEILKRSRLDALDKINANYKTKKITLEAALKQEKILSENENLAKQRMTSTKYLEKNKRNFNMSLGTIRKDISYRPSHANLTYKNNNTTKNDQNQYDNHDENNQQDHE